MQKNKDLKVKNIWRAKITAVIFHLPRSFYFLFLILLKYKPWKIAKHKWGLIRVPQGVHYVLTSIWYYIWSSHSAHPWTKSTRKIFVFSDTISVSVCHTSLVWNYFDQKIYGWPHQPCCTLSICNKGYIGTKLCVKVSLVKSYGRDLFIFSN